MAYERKTIEHFGEAIRPGKYGFYLSRETYAIPNRKPTSHAPRELFSAEDWKALDWAYEDEEHTHHSDEYCTVQRERALENFDLNMAFFASIERSAFDDAVKHFIANNQRLKPVENLRKWDSKPGVYILVLDKYKQIYIGQAWNIRKRVKQHWNGTKQFDRLLWGSVEESVLSIDAFRALDTTRIFAAGSTRASDLEAKLEAEFPRDFALNRIWGGDVQGLRAAFMLAEMKRRKLVDK
ncbi:hypothetical protein [Paramicrobacterium agarici]|uniref:hypothetical protein n=1 Tax=Paramicrobacterium agarici TaxID=630514 RepID=UPI00114F1DC1|nr:hypothetical protein [Microbacterium agarici]TQO24268.1 hypothetical protein FB385_3148 [Microbacterium agarici]